MGLESLDSSRDILPVPFWLLWSPDPRWPHAPINTAILGPDREIDPADANELTVDIAVACLGLEVHTRADRKKCRGVPSHVSMAG
jgi:hypothetical protein